MPANHGLGANEVERLSPPGPMFGEPHPEESIEAPELRPLRSAAEQGELLPEGQVLEREVGSGSARRAQGAQRSEYEGHCSPWLARRSPLVQSPDGVLANDNHRESPLQRLLLVYDDPVVGQNSIAALESTAIVPVIEPAHDRRVVGAGS